MTASPGAVVRRRAAVVYNPIKVDLERIRAAVATAEADAGWEETLWFETTVEDPGAGQTEKALAQGADTIIAAGGDGTVRVVAEAMWRSDAALALLPSGTGNLLARNLDLTLDDIENSISVAFSGVDRAIDLGLIDIESGDPEYEIEGATSPSPAVTAPNSATPVGAPPEGSATGPEASASTPDADDEDDDIDDETLDEDELPERPPVEPPRRGASRHAYVVMAGLGIDAKMLANTDDELKKKAGWLAYVDALRKALLDKNQLRFRYRLDGGRTRRLRAHTIIVGNCGSLPANILLLPEAAVDDGVFDIVLLRPEGFLGWVQIITKVIWENGVLRRSTAGRKLMGLTKEVKALRYVTGRELVVRLDSAQEIELDGDGFGTATAFKTWVVPGGLTVRVPASAA